MNMKNSFTKFAKIFTKMSMHLYLISGLMLLIFGCNSSTENMNDTTKNIVFLISKDTNNYEADRTIPLFAKQLEENFNFNTNVLLGEGSLSSYTFPDLSVLDDADLLVVFCRRLALKDHQMDQIKKYIKDGNPVMGLRTANHAFSVRDDNIPDGYSDWWEFVSEVLGCENRGYGIVGPGTDISVEADQMSHPILQGIDETYWHTRGNVYKVAPLLDKSATVLLKGKVESENLDEPVAWTRKNSFGGTVFYSSVAHPADFENPDNIKILNQAIAWLTHNSN